MQRWANGLRRIRRCVPRPARQQCVRCAAADRRGGTRHRQNYPLSDMIYPPAETAGAGMNGSASYAPRSLLLGLFDAAIASAQPAKCIPVHLPAPPRGRLIVVGAGKASAAMASAVERHWAGPLWGVVVTRYGYAVPCERIEILEAAHPVPDAAGLYAAQRILERVQHLRPDDLVLCLISGGGSALLPLPAPGLTLDHKQSMNRALLACGATISEINCVRRHLSAIKGGRLAAACHPARVLTLLISDVPGDRPTDIASGPTVP